MTEADLCEIARISTGKKSRADEELIRFLIQQGHDSVWEHAVMTFLVEVPIYTARQWQRHRIGSFTEKSGRYSEMEDYKLNVLPENNKMYSDDIYLRGVKFVVDKSFVRYSEMLEAGALKEEARQILPLCTLTKFYWTVNLRSLMNFLSLRMDPHAQQDIRENANEVYKLFEKEYPNIANEWAKREFAVKAFLKDWRALNETKSQK
jgi:thymidylate synthase (FAD)